MFCAKTAENGCFYFYYVKTNNIVFRIPADNYSFIRGYILNIYVHYGGKKMKENKVILLKHHPMNLKYTNGWYTSQVEDDLKDYVIVDVTSRVTRDKKMMNDHPSIHKDFSPFFMGPVKTSDGLTAHIFEHFWQASKVFPCHVDDSGEVNEKYLEWRKEWFSKEKVSNKTISRRPHKLLGYEDGDCLYSVLYENGTYKHLNYVEARKKIYIKEYAKLVAKTDSFKWLKDLYNKGQKIALVDFDGYNFYSSKAKEKLYNSYLNKCKKNKIIPTHSLQEFLDINDIKDAINCGFTPAGHSFIIKMLLEKDLEVVGDEVIDNIGVLDANKKALIKTPHLCKGESICEINY